MLKSNTSRLSQERFHMLSARQAKAGLPRCSVEASSDQRA